MFDRIRESGTVLGCEGESAEQEEEVVATDSLQTLGLLEQNIIFQLSIVTLGEIHQPFF